MAFKLVMLSVACLALLVSPAHSGSIGTVKSAAVDVLGDAVTIGKNVVQTKGAAVVKAGTDIASIIATALGLKIRAIGQASSSITGAMANGMVGIGDSIAKAGDTITKNKLASSRLLNSGRTRFIIERPVEEVVEVKRPAVKEVVEVKRPAVKVVEVMRPVVEEVVEVKRPVVEVKRPIVIEEVVETKRPVVEEVVVEEVVERKRPIVVEEVVERKRPVIEVEEVVEVKTPTVVEEEVVVPCEEDIVEVGSYPLREVQRRPEAVEFGRMPRINYMNRNALKDRIDGFDQVLNIGNQPSARSPYFYEIENAPRMGRTFQFKKK